MPQTKIIDLLKIKTETINFSLLIVLALVLPVINFQSIVGSLVNALLFISAVTLGIKKTFWLAFIPSLAALGYGLLPFFLWPLVTFIMASNLILIFVFRYLPLSNYWTKMIVAATTKFIFLYAASSFVVRLFSTQKLVDVAQTMFSWSQLLTALSGGLIAYYVLKKFKKNANSS
jgi:hypothetical protein